MSNDSASGGYLDPTTPLPLEDEALIDFMQSVVSQITGIEGKYVRPRWQPEAPTIPGRSITWAAVGISDRQRDMFPYIRHNSGGDGSDTLIQNETFSLQSSFYGPAADSCATLLCDGLMVEQNRAAMSLVEIKLVNVGDLVVAPDMVKEVWLYRVDVPITFRREVRRTYPVLNLLSAVGVVHTGSLNRSFDTD